MVNYDLPWNPNRLEQRLGRIHRIGQTEVGHLWNLLADETREGDVYKRLFEKREREPRRFEITHVPALVRQRDSRALILSTGEEIPRGQSVRARLLILEISKGHIESARLAECQRHACSGLYAQAVGGFVQWLAGRYDQTRVACGEGARTSAPRLCLANRMRARQKSQPIYKLLSRCSWSTLFQPARSRLLKGTGLLIVAGMHFVRQRQPRPRIRERRNPRHGF